MMVSFRCCSLRVATAVLLCFAGVAESLLVSAVQSHLEGSSVSSAMEVRSLQAETSFLHTANYVAQFQVLIDPMCLLDARPTLRVHCSSPNIQVLGTSSPFIVCDTTANIDTYDQASLECETTCATDAECQDVYMTSFANITFTCSGDTVSELDGYVEYVESSATCAADAFYFNFLRMGASCPTEVVSRPTSLVAPGDDRVYIFDDYFFECRGRGATSLSAITEEELSAPGDWYRCAGGSLCSNGTDCDVLIAPIFVNADLPLLWEEQCLESSTVDNDDAVLLPEPPANASLTSSPLIIRTQFEAFWGFLFDPVLSCTGRDNPTITISCQGASVTLMEATESIECSTVGFDTMECMGNRTTRMLGFLSKVTYECSGPELTHSSVEFPQGEASCNGNTAAATVRQAVQMGVSCRDVVAGKNFIYYGDLTFDCTTVDAYFDYFDEYGDAFGGSDSTFANSDTYKRYTCFQTANFPTGSSMDNVQMIPAVGISTDLAWLSFPDDNCFTREANPNYEPPPETLDPTFAPVTMFPTIALTTYQPTSVAPTVQPVQATLAPQKVTVAPTRAPESLKPVVVVPAPIVMVPTTVGIVQGPVAAMVNPTRSVDVESSPSPGDDNGPDTFLIGASVGGAVVAVVVVGLALLALRRKAPTEPDGAKPPIGSTVYTGGTSIDHDQSAALSRQSDRNDDMEATPYHREGATETSETEIDLPPPSTNNDSSDGYSALVDYSLASNYATVPTHMSPNNAAASSRSLRMSGEDLQFKDQSRSVHAVPMGEPIADDTNDHEEGTIIAPVMVAYATDSSVVSGKTQTSQCSNDSLKQRRAAIDP